MTFRKKILCSFSLLEIVIALSIIALVGTLVAIEGKDLLSYHRFRSKISTLALDINRYQLLALQQNMDISCKIYKKKGSYVVLWSPEGPLSIASKELSYELSDIEKISFQGKEIFSWECTISSSGTISPAGVLSFSGKKQEDPWTIDLMYPRYIAQGKPAVLHSSFIPLCPSKKKETVHSTVDK